MHCVKLLRVDSITLQEYFVVLPLIHAIELQDVLCEIAEPRMHARLHLTHFNQSCLVGDSGAGSPMAAASPLAGFTGGRLAPKRADKLRIMTKKTGTTN
jgi:hypothetical protein